MRRYRNGMSDPLPPDFDPKRLIKMMSRNGHNGFLGVEYHAHGDDWCELALPYNADLASDAETGIMASGPIITLMDMVTSMSIWFKAGKFQPQATLDLRVDYLRPAKVGAAIIGHGECYGITRSIGFVRGYAHDGDPERPLAHVAGTFMFTAVG
jgi:uncharacterized protein (TIGR00369 family)